MISINVTLIVQLINFLILLFILNAILYKPIMAKIRERDGQIESDRAQARDLAQEVADQERRHEEELAKARQTAAAEKEARLAEAKAKESERLDQARAEAGRIVEEMKATIQAETASARETLKSEMAPLAHSIATKILGRSVS